MLKILLLSILSHCVSFASIDGIGRWLLPESRQELPHEVEEDEIGNWEALWVRDSLDTSKHPAALMEQSLGMKWYATGFDKSSKPKSLVLILNNKKIVEVKDGVTRFGTILGRAEKIYWNDKSEQSLIENRRKGRRRRSRKSGPMKFGKVDIPNMSSRPKDFNPWMIERLDTLLSKIPNLSETPLETRDLSSISQIADGESSLMGFKYSDSCSLKQRAYLENLIAQKLEPQLSCLISENQVTQLQLLAILLQRPSIECADRLPNALGRATLPIKDQFFITRPTIEIKITNNTDEDSATLLHESIHLLGYKDSDPKFQEATQTSLSCKNLPTQPFHFENNSDGFLNLAQVETRMAIFHLIRDEAVSKWGWGPGEKNFAMGVICSKMDDGLCAGRFFKLAYDAGLDGRVQLPEGSEVSWQTLAQFSLFDSITDDLSRMKELAQYLKKDPQGILLKRTEQSNYLHHEFFVARSALELIKGNKGLCNSQTDDKVRCEDLAVIVKSPWFRGH